MRRAAAAVAFAALLGWLASLVTVTVTSRRDRAGPADAIVVLGAAQYNGLPSPVFRARLDHAAELWRRELAPMLIVTGGIGRGDTLSEAAAGRNYLLRRGIPDSALAAAATGRTSEPSLRAAAAIVKALGGLRVILVSDGFHMLRLKVVARRLGLEPLPSPAADSPIAASLRREVGYLLAEAFKAPAAFLVTRSE